MYILKQFYLFIHVQLYFWAGVFNTFEDDICEAFLYPSFRKFSGKKFTRTNSSRSDELPLQGSRGVAVSVSFTADFCNEILHNALKCTATADDENRKNAHLKIQGVRCKLVQSSGLSDEQAISLLVVVVVGGVVVVVIGKAPVNKA